MSKVKTDAEIQREVMRELAWDPRVDETESASRSTWAS